SRSATGPPRSSLARSPRAGSTSSPLASRSSRPPSSSRARRPTGLRSATSAWATPSSATCSTDTLAARQRLNAGGQQAPQDRVTSERKLNLKLRLIRGFSGGSIPSPGIRAGVAQLAEAAPDAEVIALGSVFAAELQIDRGQTKTPRYRFNSGSPHQNMGRWLKGRARRLKNDLPASNVLGCAIERHAGPRG